MDGRASRLRSTALVEIVLRGRQTQGALALDVEREYALHVRVGARAGRGGEFRSPLGDERWREIVEAMRQNTAASQPSRSSYRRVFDGGHRLYQALTSASPELRSYLEDAEGPRRLVIASDRPEMHWLPWEAMTDTQQVNLAEHDVSVVHAAPDQFDPIPWLAAEHVRLAPIFGPDTEGATRPLVDAMARQWRADTARGLEVVLPERDAATSLRERLAASRAEVVHVEAHGDNQSGTIRLAPGLDAEPIGLAETIGRRAMVLFWSCFSGLLQPWGGSAGATLHREGVDLVAGFATELRNDAAGALAARFYATLLDPRTGGDPEAVLVQERARLAREERLGCLWASLAVWLRRPIDFSAALRLGPRLPEQAWVESDSGATGDPDPAVATAVREAIEGRSAVHVVPAVPATLPGRLVESYPGAVVRLSGPPTASARGGLTPLLEALGAPPPDSDHPADAVLALLRVMSTYRRSLLLWSEASPREETFFQLYDDVPPNVAVLVVRRADAPADARPRPLAPHAGAAEAVGAPTLERLEALVEAGRFEDARGAWDALADEATEWRRRDPRRYRAYQAAGFWILVKLRRNREADARTVAMEDAARDLAGSEAAADRYRLSFEWRMLRANLRQREMRREEARALYVEARAMAERQQALCDAGRAGAELAYLTMELGDRLAAEHLYRRALHLLERVPRGDQGPEWRSALGRVLRDLADLVLSEPVKRHEARLLLRRSIAMHALDGRYDQLGAVLRTRGRLASEDGHPELADTFFESSAAVYGATGNSVGWGATMREIATLALARGHYEQCESILTRLTNLADRRAGESNQWEMGLTAMQLARVYWRLGRHVQALAWCNRAEALLPATMRREREEVQNLQSTLKELQEPS